MVLAAPGSAVHVQSGRSNDVTSGFTLQPSGRFSETIDFARVAFNRESTGERVYTLHILNTKTAYQFTSHFFLRASSAIFEIMLGNRHRPIPDDETRPLPESVLPVPLLIAVELAS
jgi:hypothetical protein